MTRRVWQALRAVLAPPKQRGAPAALSSRSQAPRPSRCLCSGRKRHGGSDKVGPRKRTAAAGGAGPRPRETPRPPPCFLLEPLCRGCGSGTWSGPGPGGGSEGTPGRVCTPLPSCSVHISSSERWTGGGLEVGGCCLCSHAVPPRGARPSCCRRVCLLLMATGSLQRRRSHASLLASGCVCAHRARGHASVRASVAGQKW